MSRLEFHGAEEAPHRSMRLNPDKSLVSRKRPSDFRIDRCGRSHRQRRNDYHRVESTPMLLDIAKLPTAENSAIHLHPTDDIAVARVPVPAGAELRVDGVRLVTRDAIPAGHKLALRTILPGELVLRYGQTIGRAKRTIEPGEHVHTHNLSFEELHLNYEFPSGETVLPQPPPKWPELPRLPAPGWPRGYPQLYRGRRRQQLCRPHRRDHRQELRRRNLAARCGWRGGVPARRGLRALRRSRPRPAPPHLGRGPGASQRFRRHHPRAGLRN